MNAYPCSIVHEKNTEAFVNDWKLLQYSIEPETSATQL